MGRDFQILAIDSSYGIKITFSFLILTLRSSAVKSPQLRNIEFRDFTIRGKEPKSEKYYDNNSRPGRVGMGPGKKRRLKGKGQGPVISAARRLVMSESANVNGF